MLTVGDLADQANRSARRFARRFKHAPQRILGAQQLIGRSAQSIDWIAESVGLRTAATLREHFRRILKTTPTAYRRAFFVTGTRPDPDRDSLIAGIRCRTGSSAPTNVPADPD